MADPVREIKPTRGPAGPAGPAGADGGGDAIEVRVRVSRDALVRLERIARAVSTLAALGTLAWRFLTAHGWPWSP
jgi:hypothetical protein